MNRYLALMLCLSFIGWLLYWDFTSRPKFSKALIIPAILMLIISSRPFSFWFGSNAGPVTPGDYLEGSPMDRAFFLGVIVMGLVVLVRRGFSFQTALERNGWFFALYGYYALSIVWSDNSFVAFKRIFKDCGCIMLGFLILTERDPLGAMRALFCRIACILIPLSVLTIKYFPNIGRAYTPAGDQMNVGVTQQKNSLGELVLVFGVFLLLDWWLEPKSKRKWNNLLLLLGGAWLLRSSQSKTALLCLGIAGGVMWLLQFKPRLLTPGRMRAIFAAALMLPLILFFAPTILQTIATPVVSGLGRDLTFTGRTAIWSAVLAQPLNPVVGAGYYSFWLTSAGDRAWELVGSHAATSHNGYLEAYLDGGIIALILLVVALGTRLQWLTRQLQDPYTRLRLALLLAAVVYNLMEASYFRLSLLWFTTALLLLQPQGRRAARFAAVNLAGARP